MKWTDNRIRAWLRIKIHNYQYSIGERQVSTVSRKKKLITLYKNLLRIADELKEKIELQP